MNRNSTKPENTLPWGRVTATHDDAEPDWEALRQSALERSEVPPHAEPHHDPYAAQGYGYAEQGYAEQGYAEQGYAEQGYAEQGYAEQGYAEDYVEQYAAPGAEDEWRAPAHVDPFAPTVAYGLTAPARPAPDPFGTLEPAAVQATPSFMPGQVLAAPPPAAWHDEPEIAPPAPSRKWVWGVVAAAALGIAGYVGMESMSAAAERDAKIAAAEKARQDMVAADAARLAEEAKTREAARLADEARAREAAASGTSVSAMLNASIRNHAPTAARPTGKRGPERAQRLRRGPHGEAPADDDVRGADADSHSNDPIFGL